MSFGFAFALPALVNYGGGGNNPFGQLGPTLSLAFADGATGVTDVSNPNGYTLNTNFITPEYQVAAQYAIWEANVGLVSKNFSDIITFSRASTATYFDATGTLTTAASGAPRFDYDPSTLLPRGFLIEEQRVNSIRNNTMVGASAGVAPTNWTQWNVTVNGVTIASSAAGTENGIAYIDVAVSGTCTLSGTAQTPAFESTTQIAATIGQTWTESVYWTLVSGSLADSSFSIRITETDAGGTSLVSGDGTTIFPAVGNLRSARYTHTRTLTNASTAFVVPRLRFGFVNGTTYSFTLRVGLPQMEQGAFATSVIPTSTVAVTRSADVASVNTLSPWYNQSEGTVYAESAVFSVNTQTQLVWQVLGGADSTSLRSPQGTGARLRATVGNTFSGASTGPTITNNTPIKSAVAWQGLSGRLQSGAIGEDITAATTVSATQLNIGNLAGGSFLNGYLRRIDYYPRRLSNADLQAITT